MEFQRMFEMDPDFPVARRFFALTLFELERHEEAIAVLEKIEDMNTEGDLARLHALTGDSEAARGYLERVRTRESGREAIIAELLVALNRNDEALDVLERGCARRNRSLAFVLASRRLRAGLLDNPRFHEVLRCANLMKYANLPDRKLQ